MEGDLLVPLAQQEIADHWRDKHYQVRNDQRTENGVAWAVQHIRTGQHANAWLDIHGNLRDAEGDHADVSAQCRLGNERCAHVEWRKWQSPSPFSLKAPNESKFLLNCGRIVANRKRSMGIPLNSTINN